MNAPKGLSGSSRFLEHESTLRTALGGWWHDRAMSLGAAIAFFTVFSLAPMLLVAIAVAGLVSAGRRRKGPSSPNSAG